MNLKEFSEILLNGYFKDQNGDVLKAKQIIYSKNQTIRPDIRPEGI